MDHYACKLTGPGDTAPAGKAREEITNREQIGGPAERGLHMQCIAHAACAFILCENSGSTALQGTHHFPDGMLLTYRQLQLQGHPLPVAFARPTSLRVV